VYNNPRTSNLAGACGAGNTTSPLANFTTLVRSAVPMAFHSLSVSPGIVSRISRRFRRLLTNAILAPLVTPEVR
jgi:hypothetical protein